MKKYPVPKQPKSSKSSSNFQVQPIAAVPQDVVLCQQEKEALQKTNYTLNQDLTTLKAEYNKLYQQLSHIISLSKDNGFKENQYLREENSKLQDKINLRDKFYIELHKDFYSKNLLMLQILQKYAAEANKLYPQCYNIISQTTNSTHEKCTGQENDLIVNDLKANIISLNQLIQYFSSQASQQLVDALYNTRIATDLVKASQEEKDKILQLWKNDKLIFQDNQNKLKEEIHKLQEDIETMKWVNAQTLQTQCTPESVLDFEEIKNMLLPNSNQGMSSMSSNNNNYNRPTNTTTTTTTTTPMHNTNLSAADQRNLGVSHEYSPSNSILALPTFDEVIGEIFTPTMID